MTVTPDRGALVRALLGYLLLASVGDVECGSIFWDDRSTYSWTPGNKNV